MRESTGDDDRADCGLLAPACGSLSVRFRFTRAAPHMFTSVDVSKSTLNWSRQGESDCLLKTKYCDDLSRCSHNLISAQCSECQISRNSSKRG